MRSRSTISVRLASGGKLVSSARRGPRTSTETREGSSVERQILAAHGPPGSSSQAASTISSNRSRAEKPAGKALSSVTVGPDRSGASRGQVDRDRGTRYQDLHPDG